MGVRYDCDRCGERISQIRMNNACLVFVTAPDTRHESYQTVYYDLCEKCLDMAKELLGKGHSG